ncbi:hypothetical protein BVRB_036550 [Beta vulgaris subsp. vulgaris]|uniref:Uncharacterized protein n=1 Tax=Beta vulgaris subsp. vulgaris TaxID=3555 RepID=A0A0J7YPB2_BETVV|nr:hypothetical protein BVRB_036550 [Beta vulgaris subsp. vulgaris]
MLPDLISGSYDFVSYLDLAEIWALLNISLDGVGTEHLRHCGRLMATMRQLLYAGQDDRVAALFADRTAARTMLADAAFLVATCRMRFAMVVWTYWNAWSGSPIVDIGSIEMGRWGYPQLYDIDQ